MFLVLWRFLECLTHNEAYLNLKWLLGFTSSTRTQKDGLSPSAADWQVANQFNSEQTNQAAAAIKVLVQCWCCSDTVGMFFNSFLLFMRSPQRPFSKEQTPRCLVSLQFRNRSDKYRLTMFQTEGFLQSVFVSLQGNPNSSFVQRRIHHTTQLWVGVGCSSW